MPDSNTLIATGSSDRTVRLWDPATGHQVGDPLTGHTGWVLAVAAVPMPDGRTLIATGSHDQTVRLWKLDGREVGRVVAGAAIAGIAVGHESTNGDAGLLAFAGEAGLAIIDIVSHVGHHH